GAFVSVVLTGLDGALVCDVRDAAWEPGDAARGTRSPVTDLADGGSCPTRVTFGLPRTEPGQSAPWHACARARARTIDIGGPVVIQEGPQRTQGVTHGRTERPRVHRRELRAGGPEERSPRPRRLLGRLVRPLPRDRPDHRRARDRVSGQDE